MEDDPLLLWERDLARDGLVSRLASYPTDPADLDAVDAAIEDWHAGAGSGLELWEYLGWSAEAYGRWVIPARRAAAFPRLVEESGDSARWTPPLG